MLDERTNSVLAEFVAEGFRVVTLVCGQRKQVARRNAGDLRADLRIVFLRRSAVDIGDVERLNVDESGDFQRANAVVCSLSVMAAGLIAVEAGRIDRSMAGAFLSASAEKRTQALDRDVCKGVTEGGKVRQPRETKFFNDAGHFAQEVERLAVGFPELDPERMQSEHHPLGEPATPYGVGGFVGVLDNFFSFRD